MTGLDSLKASLAKKAEKKSEATKSRFNFSVGNSPCPSEATEKPTTDTALPSVTGTGDSVVDVLQGTPPQSLQGESPASTPPLDLEPEVAERMEQFTASLETLRASFEDVELMPQIVRQIMLDLQATPEFIEVLSDADINLMMESFYKTMQLARASKEKKKATKKTSTTTKSGEAKKLLADEGFAELLGSFK